MTVRAPERNVFGRGWTTAGITLACMLLLVMARTSGAGPYGLQAVPFLLGLFVATGVIAGRAAAGLVARTGSARALVLGVSVGAATFVASGAVWNGTPGEAPLLVRLFTVTTAAATVWALGANVDVRRGARATAAGAAALLLVAIATGL